VVAVAERRASAEFGSSAIRFTCFDREKGLGLALDAANRLASQERKRESSFLLTEKKAVCSNFVPGQARVLSMRPIASPLEQSVSRASGERQAPPLSQECSRCRQSNRLSERAKALALPISFGYQSKEENVDNFKPA
jgi:hypothetical protein